MSKNISGSSIKIYNPEYIEHHSDSSDFGSVIFKIGNQTSTEHKKRKKITKKVKLIDYDVYKKQVYTYSHDHFRSESNRLESLWDADQNKFILTSPYERDKYKSFEQKCQNDVVEERSKTGGQNVNVKTTASKWSLRKILPRVSSLFGRSKGKRKQSACIYVDQIEKAFVDSSCQVYYPKCEDSSEQRRTNNQRLTNEAQPIYYTIKGNLQVPVQFGATKIVVPLQADKLQHHRQTNCSLSSSSESESLIQDKDNARRKFIQGIRKEFRKDYLKYLTKKQLAKSMEQQHPPKQDTYRVNASSRYHNTCTQYDEQYYNPNIPSSSSGFWDSLFDKLNRKYETQQRSEMYHPDYEKAELKQATTCCRNRMNDAAPMRQDTNKDKKRIKDVDCQCHEKKNSPKVNPGLDLKLQHKRRPPGNQPRVLPVPDRKPYVSDSPCESISMSKIGVKGTRVPFNISDESCRPCQSPHDKLAEAAKNKYRGEILCIHNPPCVLINGCLNMPSLQPTPINVFSATQCKKTGFSHVCRKLRCSKNKNCGEASEPNSYIQLLPFQHSSLDSDKENQGSCKHHPYKTRDYNRHRYDIDSFEVSQQCSPENLEIAPHNTMKFSCECKNLSTEVLLGSGNYTELHVREMSTQVRPHHDSKVGDNCVHVPMCQKLPECCYEAKKQFETRNDTTEYGLFTTNYLSYPSKNTSAQANQSNNPNFESVCVHVPMCQRLPKCKIIERNNGIQHKETFASTKSEINYTVLTTRDNIGTQPDPICDQKVDHFCDHVTLCQNIPERLPDGRKEVNRYGHCEHPAQCQDISACKRTYISLTAKDDVSTQVKPKSKLICRHQPQCVLIPKCLEQSLISSYVPYEGLPSCPHRPCCDMIPACCRKTPKDLVSVSAQYPASCRIV